MWQQNLFNNLLVVIILLTLAILIYSKLKNKTLIEVFREIKQIFSPEEYE